LWLWWNAIYTRLAKSDVYTRHETPFTHDFLWRHLHTIVGRTFTHDFLCAKKACVNVTRQNKQKTDNNLSDRRKLLLFSFKITVFLVYFYIYIAIIKMIIFKFKHYYSFLLEFKYVEIYFDLFQEAIIFKTTKKFEENSILSKKPFFSLIWGSEKIHQ